MPLLTLSARRAVRLTTVHKTVPWGKGLFRTIGKIPDLKLEPGLKRNHPGALSPTIRLLESAWIPQNAPREVPNLAIDSLLLFAASKGELVHRSSSVNCLKRRLCARSSKLVRCRGGVWSSTLSASSRDSRPRTTKELCVAT